MLSVPHVFLASHAAGPSSQRCPLTLLEPHYPSWMSLLLHSTPTLMLAGVLLILLRFQYSMWTLPHISPHRLQHSVVDHCTSPHPYTDFFLCDLKAVGLNLFNTILVLPLSQNGYKCLMGQEASSVKTEIHERFNVLARELPLNYQVCQASYWFSFF